MRVIVAPNTFRGGYHADRIALVMVEGIRWAAPDAEIIVLPLADGGDGTLSVLVRILGGEIHTTRVHNSCGEVISARFGLSGDRKTAIIEMAEASGVQRIAAKERDPFHFSTYGVGELIRHALDLGVTRILLGAGGSGTIDVGAGALSALGAGFQDSAGQPLGATPASLATLATIDLTGLDPRLAHTEITVLGDVSTPLRDNATVYGPQKGVRPETADQLNAVVHNISMLAQARGCAILERAWMGAGGGLAGGMAAFVGAHVVSGAQFIAQQAGLPDLLPGTDLVLTGEGRLDATSFQGKLPIVVAEMAAQRSIPVAIIAGQVAWQEIKLGHGIACFNAASGPGTLEETLVSAPTAIAHIAQQIVHLYLIAQKGARCVVSCG